MEKRYESDLTPKERRQKEWDKIKAMKWGERLDHLWTYYKSMLVVLALGIMGISIIFSAIKGALTDQLLVLGISDANYYLMHEELDALQADLLETLSKGKRYETVEMDTTFSSDTEDYYAMTKFNTIVAAGDLDVMICGQAISENLIGQDALEDWEDVLGEHYAKYEPYITEYGLELSKSPVWDPLWDFSDPTYVVVLYSYENPEGILGMLEYFFPDVK